MSAVPSWHVPLWYLTIRGSTGMRKRLGKAAGLLFAVVLSVGLLTVAEAGPASACTVYPGTSVYCWPQGGPVPPPVQPVPYRRLTLHRLAPHHEQLPHRPMLRRW